MGEPKLIPIGLLSLVLCVAVAVAVLLFAGAGTPRQVFIWLSWIPSSALLLEFLFSDNLARSLSYLAIVIPLLSCVASFTFTLIGAALIASERQHRERHADLIWATLIASVPGVLLAGYLVFAFVTYLIHKGP